MSCELWALGFGLLCPCRAGSSHGVALAPDWRFPLRHSQNQTAPLPPPQRRGAWSHFRRDSRGRCRGSDSAVILLCPVRHQGEEGLESGAVDWAGVELDSGGKQCCLIKALKASSLSLSFASLAFSRLSCSVSFSIRSLSLLTSKISFSSCLVRSSISRTGRQLSIDKKERQRGSDAGDSPLLGDGDGVAEDGEVVIGGEEGDQGENHSTERLGDPEAIQARPWTYG